MNSDETKIELKSLLNKVNDLRGYQKEIKNLVKSNQSNTFFLFTGLYLGIIGGVVGSLVDKHLIDASTKNIIIAFVLFGLGFVVVFVRSRRIRSDSLEGLNLLKNRLDEYDDELNRLYKDWSPYDVSARDIIKSEFENK
ncbi:hypothetical protein KC926_01910 [Candidatus Kaiserbacteria bacterium]|nr:hypothetical protein [Candidatus Kaiserbacteria bacterium]